MNFSIHKDRHPIETIKQARAALQEVGIFLIESNWSSFGENNHSVQLRCSKLPNIKSNGKGVTRELALASAYGEFIERLQNGFAIPHSYGLMQDYYFTYPDQIWLDKIEYIESNNPLLMDMIGPDNIDILKNDIKRTQLRCVPFVDMDTSSHINLPIDLLQWSALSTGSCSGNTPEEAISQGIGEILERFVIKYSYTNSPYIFPNIGLETIRKLDSYQLISDIIDEGYGVIVKDFTFGGRLPVIGVLLLNPTRTACKLAVASDFIFEIALNRCLTEICQGLNFENIELMMQNIDFSDNSNRSANLYITQRMGSGAVPYRLLLSNDTETNDIYNQAFLQDTYDNKAGLQFMMQVLHQYGWRLLIRDTTFLKIPSYTVYIPGLSESWRFDHRLIKSSHVEYKSILNPASLDKHELINLAQQLEIDMETATSECKAMDEIKTLLNIHCRQETDYLSLNIGLYLTHIYIALELYEKAFEHFNSFLRTNSDDTEIENSEYFSAVQLYLKMKSKSYSDTIIKATLSGIVQQSVVNEVMRDMANSSALLAYCTKPACGDCRSCEIQTVCMYQTWKTLVQNINAKMRSGYTGQVALQKLLKKNKFYRQKNTSERNLLT